MLKKVKVFVVIILGIIIVGSMISQINAATDGKRIMPQSGKTLIGTNISNEEKLIQFYGGPLELYFSRDKTEVGIFTKGYKQNKCLAMLYVDKNGTIEAIKEHLLYGVDEDVIQEIGLPATTDYRTFSKIVELRPEQKANVKPMVSTQYDKYGHTVFIQTEAWENTVFVLMSRGVPDIQEAVFLYAKDAETLKKYDLNINTVTIFEE